MLPLMPSIVLILVSRLASKANRVRSRSSSSLVFVSKRARRSLRDCNNSISDLLKLVSSIRSSSVLAGFSKSGCPSLAVRSVWGFAGFCGLFVGMMISVWSFVLVSVLGVGGAGVVALAGADASSAHAMVMWRWGSPKDRTRSPRVKMHNPTNPSSMGFNPRSIKKYQVFFMTLAFVPSGWRVPARHGSGLGRQ